MLNLQGNLNRILSSAANAKQFMAVQKHLENNTPEAIKKRELEAAEKQASQSEHMVAAYEQFLKGKRLNPEERKRAKSFLDEEQKKHTASTKKLLEDNPSSENFNRYTQGIGSASFRKRLMAKARAMELKQQKLEQKNEIKKMPTSLGVNVGDLPQTIQDQIQELIKEGNNDGKK